MKIDDNLSTVFDIEPLQQTVYDITPVPVESAEAATALDTDYNAARSNLHDIIHSGKEALLIALDVARQSEHPRAFEVVGGLMKQLADINEQLLDLHLKKQKLEGVTVPDNAGQQTIVNNNALFVGSTSELSKLISDMNKGNL